MATITPLSGPWSVTDCTGKHSLEMAFPGDITSALAAKGMIADPYFGLNEYAARWIADHDWTATRRFTVASPCQVLVLSRLDTVATVSVNGKIVLEAANAFRRYRVPLENVLTEGENEIAITFHSPTRAANAAQAAQPYFVPYTQNYPVPNGNMLRKPQCDFGWDWNAALMPSGIYGDLHLETQEDTRISDVLVHQAHRPGHVQVQVSAHFEGEPGPARARLCGQEARGEIDSGVARFTFEIPDPALWWPAGQGAQPLHDLDITIGGAKARRRIGLREIELVSEPDAVGRCFGFRVNGRDIFAKGANWIPQDALPGNARPEELRGLLQSAVDANMNMIRVWGGGWYESDAFYDLCDELGLMVWQDAMFSCSLYPADEAFLAEVAEEVKDNARRLQHRASLALWCGDNELIGALTWYEESIKDRDRYLVAYDRLNHTIERALKAVDPEVNWWPSSPSPGPLSFGDAWHDDSSGDMHFWSVWHEGRSFEHYRDVKPRFCSEFGFQSYPSMDVIRRFADPEDFNIAAPVMESHQKNGGGNARIAETMFRYFRFPVDFENFVYLSQVQQAMAIQTAVSYWRSLQPHCMGTLIWQLNDTWPTCSWASLDHGGGWKLLHHVARRFFAPVAASVVPEAGGFDIRLVSDLPDACEIALDVWAFTPGGARRRLAAARRNLAPGAGESWARIRDLAEDEMLLLTWEGPDDLKGSDWFAPKPYKSYDLQPPRIDKEVSQAGTSWEIALSAQAPAFFVALEADQPGRFSDNAILLLPGAPRVLTFTPANPAAGAPRFTCRDLHTATYG
ncbi:Exo-beta-D-glucosaminidase precursor [Pseudoruegeria aquimaris]|uniref:beta-mannosidase n=1 Tax=Pseudoruegeria aquimaris TaxID=393663 RepID=A0A1Y5TAD7_9RHOB|nr:glycoside hydrolase family 2 protein [Pseudoruegeria aquimaris]SLN57583.1 Exo-beta-D-glucosaminidase precursor [Pseudoruegeria aquimaris]